MFKHKDQPIQTYHCQSKNKACEQGPFLGEKHDVLRCADVSQSMFFKVGFDAKMGAKVAASCV